MYGDINTRRPLLMLITRDVKLKMAEILKHFKDNLSNGAAAQLLGIQDLIRKQNIMGLRWKPPKKGWRILNVNGSLTNDRVGYGGIIRTSRGNVIMAYYASPTLPT
ncbi:hypothetical protein FRX31_027446 [Thalictrum thalictroides]|uniref:Uncharacterized protein n=1 Tax=Thalictrum thalictroides TaxID=46969 RepID=A0A7J6VDY6_THATH|nr:hypothetical protein FRX31_027446 [Thalictrum thalictroides]